MQIVWLPRARNNLANIYRHIAKDNPGAAAKVVQRLHEAGIRLGIPVLAKRGRKGRVSGTRELIVPKTSCLIAYRVFDTYVEIVAVVHGKRQWPTTF